MRAVDTVVDHFMAARSELVEQREEIARLIADLDRLIDGYKTTSSVSPTASPALAPAPAAGPGEHDPAAAELDLPFYTDEQMASQPPPMKQAIVDILATGNGRGLPAGAVVEQLTTKYGWAAASVRSALAKMQNDGEIARPGRGIYCLPRSEDAEAPAATGAPDGASASGPRGGDSTHAQANSRGHGDPDEGDDRDHDRGTPVGGPV